MTRRHREADIAPFLAGELTSAERAHVAAHLAACARCRRTADAFRDTLAALADSRPEPPPVRWSAYQAELKQKLRARERAGAPASLIGRLVPVTVSLALASALFMLVGESHRDVARVAELTPVEQLAIGSRLGLFEHYPVIEKLDLLEDLEIIRHLDDLTGVQAG